MNVKQAKSLKVGDRIGFNDENDRPTKTQGTVAQVEYSGFKVEWDDGVSCNYRFAGDTTVNMFKVAA